MSKFETQKTEDNSPTLVLENQQNISEAMHSTKGAFTETCYIYGTALQHLIDNHWPYTAVSVGLGLGYVELLFAALGVKHKINNAKLLSFESEPELRKSFLDWLKTDKDSFGLKKDYDLILNLNAQKLDIPPLAVKVYLLNLFKEKKFILTADLGQPFSEPGQFSALLYDAFSEKMSSHLWQDDFLRSFLAHYAATECVFSTYAAKGSLNRALLHSGFKKLHRPGFKGKRQSTLALRDELSAHQK